MTMYSVEATNDAGHRIDGFGFRDGRQAQHWAATAMPDASRLVLRNRRGQSRGWWRRKAGVGEWLDGDACGKSV